MAKNFLQLCQKCNLLARIIYSTKTFLIEKPKFSNFSLLHCVALFDSWREGFNTVVKAAFFLSRVLFWRKSFSDRNFVPNYSRIFGENVLAGLSKMHFMCFFMWPEKLFGEKPNTGKISIFESFWSFNE